MEFKIVVEAPKDCNLILGQSHFIKTVEDVYEALASSAAGSSSESPSASRAGSAWFATTETIPS